MLVGFVQLTRNKARPDVRVLGVAHVAIHPATPHEHVPGNLKHVLLRLDFPDTVVEVVELLHNGRLYEVLVKHLAGVFIHVLRLEELRLVRDGQDTTGHLLDRRALEVRRFRRREFGECGKSG